MVGQGFTATVCSIARLQAESDIDALVSGYAKSVMQEITDKVSATLMRGMAANMVYDGVAFATYYPDGTVETHDIGAVYNRRPK